MSEDVDWKPGDWMAVCLALPEEAAGCIFVESIPAKRIIGAQHTGGKSVSHPKGARLPGVGGKFTRKQIEENKLNLRGAGIAGHDLTYFDLSGADLRDADLSECTLHGTNLIGADLRGANLYRSTLYKATLHGANLSGANLHYTLLEECKLKEVVGYFCAGIDPRGHHFRAVAKDGSIEITASCRRFSLKQAYTHWSANKDALARVVLLETLAAIGHQP